MATLAGLSLIDKAHWELHLNAVKKDTPSVKTEVDKFLAGGKLPKITHPAYIHDWLERPEERVGIEVLNG